MGRTLKILASLALFATAGLGWLFFAPEPLGGQVSYVVTQGTSMEPRFHAGDLVILRKSADYEVGDIAGYHSQDLNRVVLHRIVAAEAEGFVFKGDNNDFLDQERPAGDQILGSAWLLVPHAGDALTWVGEPLHAALIVAVIAIPILGGFTRSRRRRGRHHARGHEARTRKPSRRRLRRAPAIAASVMIASLALGGFAFAQPTRVASTRPVGYESSGRFSYSATTDPSAVYPNGRVTTGQPVFLNLVDELRLRFDYRVQASERLEVEGDGRLVVAVSEASGWKHGFVIQPTRDLGGGGARLGGSLDLRRVRSLMDRFGALTEVQQQAFVLTVTPQVRIEGTLGGRGFDQTFTPKLAFELDPLRMRLAAPEAGPLGTISSADPLTPRAPGTLSVPTIRPNAPALGPVAVQVSTLRIVAMVGAGVALLIAIVGLIGRREIDEPAAIARRYGSMILDIASTTSASERRAVQVKDVRDLVRLAQGYERFILHDESDDVHTYSVEEDSIVYWYQPALPQESNVAVLPIASGDGLSEGRRRDDLARLRSHRSR